MIAILTTKTLHHIHFVNSILQKKRSIFCITEKNNITPKFKTKVKFEDNYIQKYEKEENIANLILDKSVSVIKLNN